ncbi:short-chain dehydrogenase [Mycobacterium heckeshornense]|uniref:Short-chain dehydrogenase n=1 Tax=Mycobacterium heckeshornense TaxID=110505 RepID=A0A2G8BD90_9MYCO|nr:SDR family NAD(P)-dependent oxidoreductase [Mycobacterium heckeshornense]KMV23052.1 short-chain dehydrogenase [Mycobacterium heckeshornense]MCV7036059.1 SDR family NAD(P)-dependent oxidoreductase [Mycobacterium heckeshornense]PIJ35729.1 short-chain dehydrogenase [Mycobacterium heckeshornense]BCO35885.1 short-chain dehydrogenase [Mycobacterium heckeshornense]
MTPFAEKYGPWALVVGASDGVGALFAERIAREGVNVVLVARRQHLLEEVAAGIGECTGAATKTLAIDLTDPDASARIIDATADLEIGMLVYCAGADPNYQPFLANPVSSAEALLQRNCLVLMRLCHHYAQRMVERGRGGIVNFSSGAALAGGPNMVAYGGTKAFDLVFTEGLWTELHDKGIDVLCLILGKTDTPALRELEHRRGQIASLDEVPPNAVAPQVVIDEAFDNLTNGPTLLVGDMMRMAGEVFKTMSRNDAVKLVMQASEAVMGPH